MIKSAYIHIPFCKHICSYCDFTRSMYDADICNLYLECLKTEVLKVLSVDTLETLYIGGGTPSALSLEQLQILMNILKPYINNVHEYTMEANVESFSNDKIACVHRFGVNRISLGVQSFDQKLLKIMNRRHTYEDIKECIELLLKNGIINISIDLIYGLPEQNMDLFKKDLAIACSLPIKHISLYALTIEDNTKFKHDGVKNMDSQLETKMYEYACTILERNGFIQYEVSNFAKPGFESNHNIAYWNYDNFHGIGCGASGKENGMRYDNERNLKKYLSDSSLSDKIILSTEDECFESIMMGLRLVKGLNTHLYQQRFGISIFAQYSKTIHKHEDLGNLIVSDDYILVSKQGRLFLHDVLVDFLP